MENNSGNPETLSPNMIPSGLTDCIRDILDNNFMDANTYLGESKEEAISLFNQLNGIEINGVKQSELIKAKLDNTPGAIENLIGVCKSLIPESNTSVETKQVINDEELVVNENPELLDLVASFKEQAQNKVNSFLEQGNDVPNKEQAVLDYALLANKGAILANYRAKIENSQSNVPEGETPVIAQYTEEGYSALVSEIRSVETRVQTQSPKFYDYILQESDSVIPTRLEDAELSENKRQTITAVLSGNDNLESSLSQDGTLTVGDQRIKIGDDGEIESQIFSSSGRGEVAVNVEMPSMDSIIRENILLASMDKEIGSLTEYIKTSESKLLILKEELDDLDPDSVAKKQLEERIILTEGKILEAEEKIQSLEDAKGRQEKKLAREQSNYRKTVEGNNRRVRETTDFLVSIGVDQFPEGLFEQVIERINLSPGIRGNLGLHTQIELGKGELGFNFDYDTNEISPAERKAFTMIVNRMITGKEDEPINIEAVSSMFGTPIGDRSSFQGALQESGITGLSGIMGVFNRLENMEVEEIQLDSGLELTAATQEYPNVSVDTIVDKAGDIRIIKKANSQTLSVYQDQNNIGSNIKDLKSESISSTIRELAASGRKLSKGDFTKYINKAS